MTKLSLLRRTLFSAAMLFVVVVLISCSNDEPKPDPNPPAVSDPPPCLIQQFKSIWAVNTIYKADTFSYSYDKYGRISSARHGVTFSSTGPYQYEEFEYTYLKDRLPSKIASKNLVIELSYDEKDRLVVRKIFMGAVFIQDDLSYDESGRLLQLLRGDGSTVNEKLNYKYEEGSDNAYKVTDTVFSDYSGGTVANASYYEITCGRRVFLDMHLPVLMATDRFDYTGFTNNINILLEKYENGEIRREVVKFTNNRYDEQTNYPITLNGTKEYGTYNESYKFLCQ